MISFSTKRTNIKLIRLRFVSMWIDKYGKLLYMETCISNILVCMENGFECSYCFGNQFRFGVV